MQYIHSSGFKHGDLCHANIFLDNDYKIKIADLSMVAELPGTSASRTPSRQCFMAPEIHEDSRSCMGAQVDLFALGVILFCMRSGTYPFLKALPTDSSYSMLMDDQMAELFWM